MNAADWAEPMSDHMLVEQVGVRIIVRRKKFKFVAWHEPEQRALSLAD
jgi:hypothetical protein